MESVSKCLSFEGSAYSDQDLMLFVFFFFLLWTGEKGKSSGCHYTQQRIINDII